MADRSRTTKTSRGNRGPTPTDTDHPVDQPTVPTDPTADPTADTIVVVAHWHGHTPDLHGRGGDPHYQREDGQNEYGTWEPPGTLPYEYLGDQPDAHPDDHRHQNTAVSNHETGRESHRHAPIGGGRLPLEASDPEAVTVQSVRSGVMPGIAHEVPAPPPVEVTPGTTYTAEVEAPQARHPSGHDPADPYQQGFQAGEQATRQELANGDNTDPAAIQRSKEAARAASARLADVPTLQPPAVPVREGVSRPGTSIAHPGALSLLNTVHKVKDDGLNHEMTWLSILLPLAVEIATYHADNRDEGGTGPELAPMELLMRTRDALEHIVLPRLAREARP